MDDFASLFGGGGAGRTQSAAQATSSITAPGGSINDLSKLAPWLFGGVALIVVGGLLAVWLFKRR